MAPYFIRNLVPRKEQRDVNARPLLVALRSMTYMQWLMFLSGWFAWTCDAIDYFAVALSNKPLQDEFHKKKEEIAAGITLTLLFRSLGAVIFGVISDRFGRKWPLVANLLLVAVLQLGVGFVTTYGQFMALRSLFGIGMGGIWGLAASTALESLPVETRGIASGVLQQGYALGNLIAAAINMTFVPSDVNKKGWRGLIFMASGLSFAAAFFRAVLPESEFFVKAKLHEKQHGGPAKNKTRIFLHETKVMLKTHWILCVYAVLLMTGFNFFSHGSQDLYKDYLKETKLLTENQSLTATMIGNTGAFIGGMFAGSISQYIGRRLTIIIMVLFVGCMIPLWIIPDSFSGLAAGAFFVQFGVQGAWGVIPIQLAELSPPAFRATFPGVAYQLGNMIASSCAQIEAAIGANMKKTFVKDGQVHVVEDYAKVMGILIGVVAAYILFLTVIGPENRGSHFEQAKTAFEEGGGNDELDPDATNEPKLGVHHDHSSSGSSDKVRIDTVEKA